LQVGARRGRAIPPAGNLKSESTASTQRADNAGQILVMFRTAALRERERTPPTVGDAEVLASSTTTESKSGVFASAMTAPSLVNMVEIRDQVAGGGRPPDHLNLRRGFNC
jgi:hypothetical protein